MATKSRMEYGWSAQSSCDAAVWPKRSSLYAKTPWAARRRSMRRSASGFVPVAAASSAAVCGVSPSASATLKLVTEVRQCPTMRPPSASVSVSKGVCAAGRFFIAPPHDRSGRLPPSGARVVASGGPQPRHRRREDSRGEQGGRRTRPAERGYATDMPACLGPFTQHHNSRVRRSDGERVQMVWRSSASKRKAGRRLPRLALAQASART